MNTKIVQLVEFKEPVNIIYKNRFSCASIEIVKVFVLRSGKPSYAIDKYGDKYDFDYIKESDRNLIYRTIIRNLMFKELI